MNKVVIFYLTFYNLLTEILSRIDGLEIKKTQIISELNDFLTSTKREV
nr:MAG TPA: hypothetical protein [Caudoviricetes sp.]